MTWQEALILLSGTGLGFAVIVFVAYRWGRVSILKEQYQKAASLQDAMAEAAANGPRTRDEVLQRLEEGTI